METFTDTSAIWPVAFRAKTPDDLIAAVQDYRRNAGIQISDHDTAKEICERNKYELDGDRYSKTVQEKKRHQRVTLASAVSACRAILNVIKGNTVNDKEISRRWLICKSCPSITDISDCLSCGGAGKASNLVNMVRGAAGKGFRMDQAAGKTFCGECGCSHALMIPTVLSLQKNEVDAVNMKRPDCCWMRRDSNNYIPEEK